MSLRQLAATACAAASTLWVVGAAPPSFAQSGVTVDTGSPSGQEYAIPLQATRQDFSGQTHHAKTHNRSSGQSNSTHTAAAVTVPRRPPPSFGVGITPASSAAKATAHRTAGHHPAQPQTQTSGSARSVPAANTNSTVSATALSAAIVAAVLLAGLALTTVIRLRRRTTT